MISVFGWPDPNMGFNQSEHALFYNMHLLLNNASNLVHQQSHQVVGKNQGSDQFPSCKNDNAMHHTFLKNHILTD